MIVRCLDQIVGGADLTDPEMHEVMEEITE